MDRIDIASHFDTAPLTKFLQNKLAPHAIEWDKNEHFPLEIVRGLHDLGVFSAPIPAHYGGTGRPMIDLLTLARELGYFSPAFVSCWMGNMLAQTALCRFGKPEVVAPVMEAHLKEKTLLSFCATEQPSGNDIHGITTIAERTEGGFRLNGRKHFITNINFSSHYVVFAKTRDENNNIKRDFSAFLVPASSRGVVVGTALHKMGQRETNTGVVEFRDVHVPTQNLLGVGGEGYDIIAVCLSRTKTCITAGAVGICRRAEQEAMDYMLHSQRYGEPLLARREIQAMLAHLHAEVEGVWLLACKSGATWDATGNAIYDSSVAKLLGADLAVRFVSEALELTGGSGYMQDSFLSKLYRDVKLLEIYEGPSKVLEALIAKAIYAPPLKKQRLTLVKEAA